MQWFTFKTTQPVNWTAFLCSWNSDAGSALRPATYFTTDGKNITVRVNTTKQAPWPRTNLEQALRIALHRVAPNCAITEFEELPDLCTEI